MSQSAVFTLVSETDLGVSLVPTTPASGAIHSERAIVWIGGANGSLYGLNLQDNTAFGTKVLATAVNATVVDKKNLNVYAQNTTTFLAKLVEATQATTSNTDFSLAFINGVLDEANGIGYFLTTAVLKKITLSTMAVAATTTLTGGALDSPGLFINSAGTFVYVLRAGSPGGAIKIQTSDMTEVATFTMDDSDNPGSGALDSAGGILYVATKGLTPEHVYKVTVATMVKSAELTLTSGENNTNTAVLDVANGFLYLGTKLGGVSPDIIVKVKVSDMTRVGIIQLVSTYALNVAVFDQLSGFVYFLGQHTTSTKLGVAKIKVFTDTNIVAFDSTTDAVVAGLPQANNQALWLASEVFRDSMIKLLADSYSTVNASLPSVLRALAANLAYAYDSDALFGDETDQNVLMAQLASEAVTYFEAGDTDSNNHEAGMRCGSLFGMLEI